jgi:curved DNA-binding protein CbpA
MDDVDPAQAFFGDGEVDLYGALELSPDDATPESIRKAYRRLSLLHHPDKVATQSADAQELAKTTFQRIGFAYAVLSDPDRRSRFDRTGRTDAAGAEPDEGWDAYFAELWSGEVSAKTLDDFFDTYEGAFRVCYVAHSLTRSQWRRLGRGEGGPLRGVHRWRRQHRAPPRKRPRPRQPRRRGPLRRPR